MTAQSSRYERERHMTSDQGNYNWIKTKSLSDVFIRLLELYSSNPDKIDGTTLGHVAKRLIAAEEKIGGPYWEAGNDKFELNTLIDHFFTNLNSPLENVRKYLLENSEANKLTIDKIEYKITSHYKSTANPIAKIVQREIQASESITSSTMLKVWEAISTFDKRQEVTHLSKYFADSLISKPKVPTRNFALLGAANFYAWMSYSIYDDIIDGEDKTSLLPVANILQRKALSKYLTVCDFGFIQKSFDEVDTGNLKELHTYRFPVCDGLIQITHIPDYKDDNFIASCAIGHTLGPSIILERYTNSTTEQRKAIEKGFRFYLIARQLNDDAHDWIEDLQNGHGSLVLFFLFKKIALKPGTHSVDKLTEIIKKYFWESGLEEITNLTIMKINSAKDSFMSSGLITQDNVFFDNVLDPIAISAQKGSYVLKNQRDFLNIYTQS